MLPEVRDSAGTFGTTEPACFGAPIAIRGIAGDQQAALIGQACFRPGMVKSTYGTGCFALLNTGREGDRQPPPPGHHHRLPVRRPAHLRAGRLHLRRRRGGAVAARRARADRLRRRDRRAGRRSRSGAGRLHGARLRRPGRAALGQRGPGAADRHDPRHHPQGTGARGPGMRRLPDPRPAGCDAGRPRRRHGPRRTP